MTVSSKVAEARQRLEKSAIDKKMDKKLGVKENSPADKKMDKKLLPKFMKPSKKKTSRSRK